MNLIKDTEFGGERPLFESHDLRLENVIIRSGESAIRECSNIEAVDCRRLGLASEELERRLVSETGLWLNAGTMYGTEGEGFMRWNIACPRATLAEGLKRLADFVHPQINHRSFDSFFK